MTDDTDSDLWSNLATGQTLEMANKPFTYQKTGSGPAVLYFGDEALAADAKVTLQASELAALIHAHVVVHGRFAVQHFAQTSKKLTRVLRDDGGKIVGTLSESITDLADQTEPDVVA